MADSSTFQVLRLPIAVQPARVQYCGQIVQVRDVVNVGQFETGSTSTRVRRLGADNPVIAVIRTLQHKPRLSSRCVGQTLTQDVRRL